MSRNATTPTAPGERTMFALEHGAVGPSEASDGDVPDVALVDDAVAQMAKPAHAVVDQPITPRSGSAPRRSRTARPRPRRGRQAIGRPAAATSSRNSGCGRSGRLLNSGWAWVPTQNGWSASSMNSTSLLSGEVPQHTNPAASKRAR